MDIFKSYTALEFMVLPLDTQNQIYELIRIENEIKIKSFAIKHKKDMLEDYGFLGFVDEIKEDEKKILELASEFNLKQMKLNMK
jgi:hypothetical protein